MTYVRRYVGMCRYRSAVYTDRVCARSADNAKHYLQVPKCLRPVKALNATRHPSHPATSGRATRHYAGESRIPLRTPRACTQSSSALAALQGDPMAVVELKSRVPKGATQSYGGAERQRLFREWDTRLAREGLRVLYGTSWDYVRLDTEAERFDDRLDPIEFDQDALDDECGTMPYGAARLHALESKRAVYGRRDGEDLAMPTSQFGEAHAARARRGGGLVALTPQQWYLVLSAFDYACAYCESHNAITMDHIEPLSRGGDHAVWNVVPACWPCNIGKRTSDVEDWCARRGLDCDAVLVRIARAQGRVEEKIGALRPTLAVLP